MNLKKLGGVTSQKNRYGYSEREISKETTLVADMDSTIIEQEAWMN